MNEEQICELAKDKALDIQKYIIDGNVDIDSFAKDCCLAGAHSRDEEIKDLEARIYMLEKAIKVNEYFEEAKLDQLRNPWISVEDGLPPEFKPVIVMFESGIIINAFVTMVKDEPAWHPSVEIPIGSDVIFWMYIPQIEK